MNSPCSKYQSCKHEESDDLDHHENVLDCIGTEGYGYMRILSSNTAFQDVRV